MTEGREWQAQEPSPASGLQPLGRFRLGTFQQSPLIFLATECAEEQLRYPVAGTPPSLTYRLQSMGRKGLPAIRGGLGGTAGPPLGVQFPNNSRSCSPLQLAPVLALSWCQQPPPASDSHRVGHSLACFRPAAESHYLPGSHRKEEGGEARAIASL